MARSAERTVDLERIAGRIIALAEAAAREHVASLGRSQADGLLTLVRSAATSTPQTPVTTNWNPETRN